MTFTVQLLNRTKGHPTKGSITIDTTGTGTGVGRITLSGGDITLHSGTSSPTTGAFSLGQGGKAHHPPANPPTQGRGVGTDSSEQAGTHDDLDDQVMEWLADFNQAAAEDK